MWILIACRHAEPPLGFRLKFRAGESQGNRRGDEDPVASSRRNKSASFPEQPVPHVSPRVNTSHRISSSSAIWHNHLRVPRSRTPLASETSVRATPDIPTAAMRRTLGRTALGWLCERRGLRRSILFTRSPYLSISAA